VTGREQREVRIKTRGNSNSLSRGLNENQTYSVQHVNKEAMNTIAIGEHLATKTLLNNRAGGSERPV